MDDNLTAAASPPNALEELVERWWENHFPGSAVARDTRAWNVAHGAKEALKRLLAELHGGTGSRAVPEDKDLEGSI